MKNEKRLLENKNLRTKTQFSESTPNGTGTETIDFHFSIEGR